MRVIGDHAFFRAARHALSLQRPGRAGAAPAAADAAGRAGSHAGERADGCSRLPGARRESVDRFGNRIIAGELRRPVRRCCASRAPSIWKFPRRRRRESPGCRDCPGHAGRKSVHADYWARRATRPGGAKLRGNAGGRKRAGRRVPFLEHLSQTLFRRFHRAIPDRRRRSGAGRYARHGPRRALAAI